MKKKFNIRDLAMVGSATFELVHPSQGETGIEVTVRGPLSTEWKEGRAVYAEAFDAHRAAPEDKELEAKADKAIKEWVCACIISWDDESFEGPATPENKAAFFNDDGNAWATAQIGARVLDNNGFFPKLPSVSRKG